MRKIFDIFISYRADENKQKAEHLYTLLNARFPGQISYDKEFPGGRWDQRILRRIDQCKDMVVLLTQDTFKDAKEEDASKYKRWSTMPFEEVVKEIETYPDPDILRIEVSRAIAHGKNIVPVVHTSTGTNFSDFKIPSDIAALIRYEGVIYNDDDPNQLMANLVPKIIQLLRTKKPIWKPVIIALFLLIGFIASLLLWQNNEETHQDDNYLLEQYKSVVQDYSRYADKPTIEDAYTVLRNCSTATEQGIVGAYFQMGVVYGNLGNLVKNIDKQKSHYYYLQEEKAYQEGHNKGSFMCSYGLGKVNFERWYAIKDSLKTEALEYARKAQLFFSKANEGHGLWQLTDEKKIELKLQDNINLLEKWENEVE